jgi:hypothetical protein
VTLVIGRVNKMGKFTEQTINEEGWYFWYPSPHRCHSRTQDQYMYVEKDMIPYLNCPRYEGTYIGPIIPPRIEDCGV